MRRLTYNCFEELHEFFIKNIGNKMKYKRNYEDKYLKKSIIISVDNIEYSKSSILKCSFTIRLLNDSIEVCYFIDNYINLWYHNSITNVIDYIEELNNYIKGAIIC